MIAFGNITGGCGECGTRTVHSIVAAVLRYGWTMNFVLSCCSSSNDIVAGTAPVDFRYSQLLNWGTLTISGLTVHTEHNGAHSINLTTGAGYSSIYESELRSQTLLAELLDTTWGYGFDSITDSGAVVRLYHREYVGAPVYDFQWVPKHAVTFALTDPQTDSDAMDECSALLDEVDFDDVLLFDPAHDFEYIVVKCPAWWAGKSDRDFLCNGLKFSDADPGDVLVLGEVNETAPPNKPDKVAVGGTLRGKFHPITVPGCLYATTLCRVKINNPISYSESTYQRPIIEQTFQTATGPLIVDTNASYALFNPGISVWFPTAYMPPGGPAIDWAHYIERTGTEYVNCSDPACADVPVVASATTSLTFDGQNPTEISNDTHPLGYAVVTARIIRFGITCANNYPPELAYGN